MNKVEEHQIVVVSEDFKELNKLLAKGFVVANHYNRSGSATHVIYQLERPLDEPFTEAELIELYKLLCLEVLDLADDFRSTRTDKAERALLDERVLKYKVKDMLGV